MSDSQKTLDLIEEGRLKEAKEKFIEAMKNDDDDLIYSLAEELYSMGFSDMAKEAYKNLLKKYPNEDELKVNLADIYISEGKDDLALEYLSQISKESDAYVQSLIVQADLYQTQGMFEVSEHKLLQALNILPSENVILFALAELYYNMKNYKQAVKYYLVLLKKGVLELSKVNIVQRMGVSYASFGKFDMALGYLEQIDDLKLDSDTRFQLAFTQQKLGMDKQAIKNYEILQQTNPDYTTVYVYLGELYAKEHNYRKALETVKLGLKLDEFNILLYQKAAEYAINLGNKKEALKFLKLALTQDSDNLMLVTKLSNLYLDLNKNEENINLLNQYIELGESDSQFYWNLGRSYASLDDYQKAQYYYDKAKDSLLDNLDFLKDAAFFYRNVGKRNISLTLAKKYLKLNPSDIEINELFDSLLD